MEVKEAIEVINNHWPSTSLGQYTELIEALRTVINAAQKQIDRKPKIHTTSVCGVYDLQEAFCDCGCKLLNEKDCHDLYCPDCGQKIDWSVTE